MNLKFNTEMYITKNTDFIHVLKYLNKFKYELGSITQKNRYRLFILVHPTFLATQIVFEAFPPSSFILLQQTIN